MNVGHTVQNIDACCKSLDSVLYFVLEELHCRSNLGGLEDLQKDWVELGKLDNLLPVSWASSFNDIDSATKEEMVLDHGPLTFFNPLALSRSGS
jgi:hypothetical protein